MSRFWSEPRRLHVAPDALTIDDAGERRRIAFDGPAQAAFAAAAASLAPRRGSRWHVVLADALVRYLVIEWPAGLKGRAERAAFVAHRFREVHGASAPEWRTAMEPAVAGAPLVACAAPAALVDAVEVWARAQRLRLDGITGEFVAVYNESRQALDAPTAALAVQRGGRLTIGLWRDGRWSALRSQPFGMSGEAMLRLLLDAPQRSGGDDGGGLLYCTGGSLSAPPGWHAVPLDGEVLV